MSAWLVKGTVDDGLKRPVAFVVSAMFVDDAIKAAYLCFEVDGDQELREIKSVEMIGETVVNDKGQTV